jgi:hypothetical protein
MLPENLNLRIVIEEERFKLELQKIIPKAPEADDFVEGAKWALAHSPEIGRQIGTSNVWYLPMAERPNLLPVILYYTFDEEIVNLMSIQETLYPPKE